MGQPESREAEHFGLWFIKAREAGRPLLDLTWGNCVRETGLLRR
jgi:hypothetical protein